MEPRQKPGRKGPLQPLIPLDEMKRVLGKVIARPPEPKPEKPGPKKRAQSARGDS